MPALRAVGRKKKKWVCQQIRRPEMASKPHDPQRAVLIVLVRFLLLTVAKTRSQLTGLRQTFQRA